MKTLLFILLLGLSLFNTKSTFSQISSGTETSKVDTFIVCGNCFTCRVRIHDELSKLQGLISFDWSWQEYLAINYNPQEITPAEFLEPIANVGHDNEMFPAPIEAYETLIGSCCEYDRWLTYEEKFGSWMVKTSETCKGDLLSIVTNLHGITSAQWDNEILSLSFYTQINDLDNILFILANAGYDNEKFSAPDEAYNALPEDCQYNRATVSINSRKIEQLNIYPNPVTGNSVSIKQAFDNCRIIDQLGKTINTIEGNNEGIIDISSLKNGSYHLLINSANKQYSSTLIKQ